MKNLLLFTIAFLFFSCNNDKSIFDFDQDTYDKNLALWTESDIKDYSFTQQMFSSSFGGQPKVKVMIKDGSYDSFTVEPGMEGFNLEFYKTVPELYAFIERIATESKAKINDAEDPMEGVVIEVEYHDTFYYPTKIYCGGIYPDGYVGGLSITINVSDFQLTE
ncbi:DUF6174 domain-containing protein [Flammeovirga aprica]|uniref:Lipoprotein n=1 Tax=Flammeovirga aprica JL-4 TaxID=694437 RepID=A0A7X9XAC5_9BACT|nr:DUF6174 domain-containing protein [Flammeovirga aprica]NME69463.1 hypothetical protein [Flammeovirga aprica JL-4]